VADHTSPDTQKTAPAATPTVTSTATSALPRRLVFKTPSVALVVVVFLAVCESTIALALPWFSLLYLIPVGIAVWVLRTRTVIDQDNIVVRRVFSRRVIAWSDVASLRLRDQKWLNAVLADDTEVPLPSVRTRHLPVLALITGGRLADPTAHVEPAESIESTPAPGVPDTREGGVA
jgi:hypothetical protein